jgi:hypothetical protein
MRFRDGAIHGVAAARSCWGPSISRATNAAPATPSATTRIRRPPGRSTRARRWGRGRARRLLPRRCRGNTVPDPLAASSTSPPSPTGTRALTWRSSRTGSAMRCGPRPRFNLSRCRRTGEREGDAARIPRRYALGAGWHRRGPVGDAADRHGVIECAARGRGTPRQRREEPVRPLVRPKRALGRYPPSVHSGRRPAANSRVNWSRVARQIARPSGRVGPPECVEVRRDGRQLPGCHRNSVAALQRSAVRSESSRQETSNRSLWSPALTASSMAP